MEQLVGLCRENAHPLTKSEVNNVNVLLPAQDAGTDSGTDEPPAPKRSRIENRSPKCPLKNDGPNDATRPTKTIRKYQYGNYDRYYGYRNPNAIADPRLDAFKQHRQQLFADKDVLDIGCNAGTVTMAVARELHAKHVTGIDIDRSLIARANQLLNVAKKAVVVEEAAKAAAAASFPHNVIFKHGNYILADEKLLELERPQFDTILCLSVTKWMHLNAGDSGLMMAFRRMFRSLRPGGSLVLEAQDWKSYKRRKKLTDEIHETFKRITLMPAKFEEALLTIGFQRCYEMKMVVANESHGFRRPIKV